MKISVHSIFLLFFLIVQATWFEAIALFGIKPNLFIVYIVTLSCFCSKKEGAVTGFFFGLMLDFMIGKVIGLNAVLMLLMGLFIAYFCERVIRKNTVFIVMLIVLLASFFYELLYYIVSFVGDLNFKAVFLKTLVPECIFNSIISIPIYGIIKKLSGRLWKDKGEVIG